jgi:hypothetical protein
MTTTTDLDFEAFHLLNPHVYERLTELAQQLHRQGITRYGIAGLFEVLRYEHALTTAGDEFKLNNNYRAYYARLIMDRNPNLNSFFETRRSMADKKPSTQTIETIQQTNPSEKSIPKIHHHNPASQHHTISHTPTLW